MSEWQPPEVQVGDIVFWRPDKGLDPSPALVLETGPRTITVMAFAPMFTGGLTRDGVHHMDDPDRRAVRLSESGVWEHTPRHKKLADLLS